MVCDPKTNKGAYGQGQAQNEEGRALKSFKIQSVKKETERPKSRWTGDYGLGLPTEKGRRGKKRKKRNKTKGPTSQLNRQKKAQVRRRSKDSPGSCNEARPVGKEDDKGHRKVRGIPSRGAGKRHQSRGQERSERARVRGGQTSRTKKSQGDKKN